MGHNVQNIGETTPIKSSLGGTPWQEAHADPHAWPWVAEDLPSHTIGSEDPLQDTWLLCRRSMKVAQQPLLQDDDERSRAAVQDAFEHRLQANTGDMVARVMKLQLLSGTKWQRMKSVMRRWDCGAIMCSGWSKLTPKRSMKSTCWRVLVPLLNTCPRDCASDVQYLYNPPLMFCHSTPAHHRLFSDRRSCAEG